jgi:hypothetical protein
MMGSTIMTTLRKFFALLITCVLLTANAALAQLVSPADARQRNSAEITTLRRIEQSVLPPTIVVGPPSHHEIVDYYCVANASLRNRFEEAREIFASENRWPFRAMTVVAGSAGIGKTFIKGQVYSDIPREQIWKFDIRELFDEFSQQGIAELKPDLQHRDRVYNRLLSLNPAGRKAFEGLLESNTAAFVVVDSLDEIHPDDYFFVLDRLEQLALDVNHGFIHLVVFGRPTAFQDYLQDRAAAARGSRPGLRSFLLNKPEFRTNGDLTVSNWNFDCWKYGLCRGQSNESSPMMFEDYQRWCEQGFLAEGEFADVVFDQNAQMTPTARKELQRWSMEYPVVASVLPNLAANGMVRDILADCLQRGEGYDERRFMDDFLTKWLERDTRSDDRPSRLKPEYFDSYLQLLEAVAVKYAGEERIDEQGFFDVASSDQVVIKENGAPISVPVQTVLNRSGLVTVDPRLPYSQRFRFEPFWFHRLLVQTHQERRDRELTSSIPTARYAETAQSAP